MTPAVGSELPFGPAWGPLVAARTKHEDFYLDKLCPRSVLHLRLVFVRRFSVKFVVSHRTTTWVGSWATSLSANQHGARMCCLIIWMLEAAVYRGPRSPTASAQGYERRKRCGAFFNLAFSGKRSSCGWVFKLSASSHEKLGLLHGFRSANLAMKSILALPSYSALDRVLTSVRTRAVLN